MFRYACKQIFSISWVRITQKVNAVVMRNIWYIFMWRHFQNAKQKISFLSKYLFENETVTFSAQCSIAIPPEDIRKPHWFSDVFRGYSNGILGWFELTMMFWRNRLLVSSLVCDKFKSSNVIMVYFFMIPRITPDILYHHHTNKTLVENKIGKYKLMFMLFRWWCCSCMA